MNATDTKKCNCCNAQYTAASWATLPCIGSVPTETDDGAPATLELRNCGCGSTLGIEIPNAAQL